MKTIILIACLILAVSSAPQEQQRTEETKGGPVSGQQTAPTTGEKKSAKLQFGPNDGQYYTGSLIPQQPEVPSVLVADQVAPASSYYYSGVQTIPGSVATVSQGPVVPYAVSTVTGGPVSVAGAVLPAGHVYEHHGAAHVGHLASAVHVRRTPAGAYYASPAVAAPNAGYPYTYSNVAGGLAAGQIQYINGQPAQYINGQWYYINPSQVAPVAANPVVYSQGGVVAAAANRPNVPSSTVYTSPLYNTAVQRPVVLTNQYAPVDNKWYTKTNVQQIRTPFYAQVPQFAQTTLTGVKTQAPVKSYVASSVSEAEKSDW